MPECGSADVRALHCGARDLGAGNESLSLPADGTKLGHRLTVADDHETLPGHDRVDHPCSIVA